MLNQNAVITLLPHTFQLPSSEQPLPINYVKSLKSLPVNGFQLGMNKKSTNKLVTTDELVSLNLIQVSLKSQPSTVLENIHLHVGFQIILRDKTVFPYWRVWPRILLNEVNPWLCVLSLSKALEYVWIRFQ